MRKCFLAVILTVILAVTASCTEQGSSKGDKDLKLSVYYLRCEESQDTGELIGKREISVSPETDLLHRALSEISSGSPDEGYFSPFPSDVQVYSYAESEGVLSLFLTPTYKNMTEIERSIANACLALTLCGLDDVDSISIYCESTHPLAELSLDNLILPHTEQNEYEKQITVYFPDESNQFLEAEKRALTVGQDRQLVEYVVDELLILGPQNERLKQAVPEGTKLLSLEVKNKLCTINLSREFYDNRSTSAAGERMTIYSIVNSITEIPDIEAVQILIEGEKYAEYSYLPIDKPIIRNIKVIGPVRTERGESEITLYFGYNQGTELIWQPFIVTLYYGVSVEENAINSLLETEPLPGYIRLIPESTRLISLIKDGDTCIVNLTSEFSSGTYTELALKSIAATIFAIGGTDGVIIQTEGTEVGSYSKSDNLWIVD